jgi:hypothetical protein
MDWTHTITIISTTIGAVGGVFLINRKDMQLMDKNHRQDIAKIDAKIDKMDENHREDLAKIDSKWENLFKLFVELKLKQDK